MIALDYAGLVTTFSVGKLRCSLVDCSSPVTGLLLRGPALTLNDGRLYSLRRSLPSCSRQESR